MCTNVSTSSLYSPSPTDNEFRLSEFEMHWNTRMLGNSVNSKQQIVYILIVMIVTIFHIKMHLWKIG